MDFGVPRFITWMGLYGMQSLLIQGRGRYNCSDLPASSSPDCLSCNTTNPKCSAHVLPVTPGKTYRLRIGSVASLSSLNFILEVSQICSTPRSSLPALPATWNYWLKVHFIEE